MEAAAVFAGVGRVLELHQPAPYVPGEWPCCRECGHAFPCPTFQALGSAA